MRDEVLNGESFHSVLEARVTSPEALYDAARTVDWSRYLTPDHTLAVDSNVRDSHITHSKYAALKVKDAICDQFVERVGRRPSVDVDQPMVGLNLHVYRDEAVLSLDSSGESLHKRGYRPVQTKAPLNEALAAGLVLLTGWKGETAFADPLSGSGTLPTDGDLVRTITRGVRWTAMPTWHEVPDKERFAVVAYVKTLSKRWKDDAPEAPLVIPPAPRATPQMLVDGKRLYERAKCAECHGERGKGDGPSAATLKDDSDRPIRPADFTRGEFRGGATVVDVYRTMTTGLDGTPMPSFGDTMREAERWAISFYVLSLSAWADPLTGKKLELPRGALRRLERGARLHLQEAVRLADVRQRHHLRADEVVEGEADDHDDQDDGENDASVTVRVGASVSGRAGPRRWPDAHEGRRAKTNNDSRFMGSYCGLIVPITL